MYLSREREEKNTIMVRLAEINNNKMEFTSIPPRVTKVCISVIYTGRTVLKNLNNHV